MKMRSWLTLLPFALATALALWALPHAPERVPTHWGPDGQADQWGTPFWGYFQMIILLFPMALLMLAISKFSKADRRNAAILQTIALAVGLLTLIETASVIFHWDAVKTTLVSLGLVFTMIGNYLGKAGPSAFLGLRTPWVYLSRRAWHASQRRTGLWFTIYGLALLLPGLLLPSVLLVPTLYPIGLIAGILIMLIGLTYSSYLDYKRDPNPEPVDLRGQTTS